MEVAEKEVESLKTERKSRFLIIFSVKVKEWDKAKVEEFIRPYVKPLGQLWKEGQSQSWWEGGRRQIRAGLTFARFELERREEEIE